MKRTVLALIATTLLLCASAQNTKNNRPDAITGTYSVSHAGHQSRVRVFKAKNGTYTAQCIWLRDSIDPATGKLLTDSKNPDKSLRNTPCTRIIIFRDMQYNSKKQRWDSGKIYDPTRGIVANCSCEFLPDGRLKVRGTLLGIGESVYWKPL